MLALPAAVYIVLYWICLGGTVFALIDAATRRADAFPAADRQTKPIWLGILAGSTALQLLFPGFGILGLAAIVAAIVYLVDVRRRVIEVTRGPRY